MRFFQPDHYFSTLDKVPEEFFKNNGIKLIICDIDNTLATYDDPDPTEYTVLFMERMKREGIAVELISNNNRERVERFSRELDCHFVADGKKPYCSAKPIREAMKKAGAEEKETMIIGDQVFTDVLAGRNAGLAVAFLVKPIKDKTNLFFKTKRLMEVPVLKKYKRIHGKN